MTRHIKTLLLCTLLIFGVSACGGLAGEPKIVATLPPPTSVPSEAIDSTITTISLTLGAESYAENCTRCHGETGAGDGEFAVNGQLPIAPPDFTDYAYTRTKTPREWFDAITNGNLDALMPPWSSLDQSERLALTYHLYTISYKPAQIEQGAEIWEANCAKCHGETGAGDGPSAANLSVTVPDFSAPLTLLEKSDDTLITSVTNGVGNAMPSFADTLSDDERIAVIAYTRTLVATDELETATEQAVVTEEPATDNTEAEATSVPETEGTEEAETSTVETTAEPEATEEAASTGITVTGIVSNGTEGFDVPDDAVVNLLVLDTDFNEMASYETTPDENGAFVFDDVLLDIEYGYITTVRYQDKLFGSSVVTGDTATEGLDLPVTIYEVTYDPEAILINNALSQISVVEGGLQIIEIVNFVNRSDRMYSALEPNAESRYPSISIVIPENASLIDFGDTTQYYVVGDDGVTVSDTRALLPNESRRMHLAYFIPAANSASINEPMLYELEGDVTLLLDPEISITSEQLLDIGTQSMGESVFQGYSGTLALQPGDTISYDISFTPVETSSSNSSTTNSAENVFTSDNAIPIGLTIAGVIALIGAIFLYMRDNSDEEDEERPAPVVTPKKSPANPQLLIDGLIQQIAELDEQYQNGEIEQDEYELMRGKFKSRLKELMKGSDS